MPAFFLLSAPRATTMPVLFVASGTASPQHASRSPGGLHLLPSPRHKRPSSPNGGVQSWAFPLATTFRKTLREAFLINPCFFFMAGDMATWQHNRLSTDERCGASKAADSSSNQTRPSRPQQGNNGPPTPVRWSKKNCGRSRPGPFQSFPKFENLEAVSDETVIFKVFKI